jgi:hypothetical protein
MSPQLQTALALTIVAVTVTWLILRVALKRKSGCGGDCGCEASTLKAKVQKRS